MPGEGTSFESESEMKGNGERGEIVTRFIFTTNGSIFRTVCGVIGQQFGGTKIHNILLIQMLLTVSFNVQPTIPTGNRRNKFLAQEVCQKNDISEHFVFL